MSWQKSFRFLSISIKLTYFTDLYAKNLSLKLMIIQFGMYSSVEKHLSFWNNTKGTYSNTFIDCQIGHYINGI